MSKYLYTTKIKAKNQQKIFNDLYYIRSKLNDLHFDNYIFVAGGYARSLYTNTHPNDIDIYFKNLLDYTTFHDCLCNYKIHETEFATLFKINYLEKIHLIKKFVGSPQSILDSFDFTVVKAGFKINKHENIIAVYHKDFVKDNKERNLIIDNDNINLDILLRIIKYTKEYSYNISKEELRKIVTKLSKKYNFFNLLKFCMSFNNKTGSDLYKEYYGLKTKEEKKI